MSTHPIRAMRADAPAPVGDGAGRGGYRLVALIIACALFMEQMDATVLATALPAMAREFGVSATRMSSALTAYLLALAIFIPASGRLADRFGSKTIFRLAILLFLAGSVACAQAPSLWALIAARFFQGIAGAMILPIARLVLLRSVAKEEMVEAMSWLIMPAMLGPILGPPIGGFIVTYLNWRWIFYLNLPIGLIGAVLVSLKIQQIRSAAPAGADVAGFLLSGVSLGSLLFGFESASRPGEILTAAVLIAVGLAAGALYLRHARRTTRPILDVTLMRTPTFGLTVIAGSLTRITQGAQPFLLPLMFQLGFGVSAALSGLLTLAGAAGAFAMKWVAPGVLRRYGFRRTMIVNGALASAGYALCGLFRPGWPSAAIFLVLAFSGASMSFQFTAYNTLAFADIEPTRTSDATSFYATFQQLMLSLGVCVGAGSLQLAQTFAPAPRPLLWHFSLAFGVVTSISLLASVWILKIAPGAGDELCGRRPAAVRSV